jgi:Uncharacterized conserved protein (DUF2285)
MVRIGERRQRLRRRCSRVTSSALCPFSTPALPPGKRRCGDYAPFVDPDIAFDVAPVFWLAGGIHLMVQPLFNELNPQQYIDVVNLPSWRRALIDGHGNELVVLQNKQLMLSLRAHDAGLLDGPRGFSVRIDGRSGVTHGAKQLRLFDHLLNDGSPVPRAFATSGFDYARLHEALIALDGDLAGIRYREIAAVLFGEHAAAEDWGRGQSTLRQKVRRTVNRGHMLAGGGYLKLLK